MSKFEGNHGVKIEAGQILDPDCFPQPNELVCIQVPKVFDQVSLRECVTRCVHIKNGHCDDRHNDDCGCPNSNLTFEGATDFDIVEVKVISKTDSISRPGFKRIKLSVRMKYTIHLAEGSRQFEKEDEVSFNLTVNEIYCPNCLTQVGIARSTDNFWERGNSKHVDIDGTFIKVEALAESFNDAFTHNDVLTLDIGAFFIVKCESVVQLLIPAYGYCPVPPEQKDPTIQNCAVFNDRIKTPFPTKFFPDQKWNPLDKKELC